jgi:ADP-ribose pyrophosphatase YjhB (NUDIX family)
MELFWLNIAKKLQSIAQAGLEFGHDKYDLERYQMIRDISVEIMKNYSDAPVEKIIELFASEKGYQTPKVDVRGVVFREGKILMVREGIDGNWSLPGGWADVGYTPFQIAEKEVWEEAGIYTKAVRLLTVFDKMFHGHPPDKYHVYKLFILCNDSGGDIKPGMETLEVRWVDRNERLPLSLPRLTQEELDVMFEYLDNPDKDVLCD